VSMRSVDIQSSLPKVADLAKTRQTQDKESETVQHHLVARLGERVSRRSRQVTSLPGAENPRVEPRKRNDDDRRGRGRGRGGLRSGLESETRETGLEATDTAGHDRIAGDAEGAGTGRKLDIVV
jgi:hypothetical protein